MKIAIIGSGISGLTAAYLLNKKHEITIFESNDYIGGHTHTHSLDIGANKVSVDSGFIVYNENTYPNFIKILQKLKVESQKTQMGFSVKSIRNNLEYSGNSLGSMFSQRSNIFKPSFLIMLKNIIRFNKEAEKQIGEINPSMSLGDFLAHYKYSPYFINNYILPIGAAIWSTKVSSMFDMSAIFFINFFKNHSLLQIKNRAQWYVIKGGSNQYIEKMIDSFRTKIRLSSPIKKVIRNNEKVEIVFGASDYSQETFDSVIFANHSDQALEILDNPSKSEKEILSSIKYQKNNVLLHFDESILPKRKSAWSSWNFLLDNDSDKPVALTYNMNILQNLKCDETLCVSLNSEDHIDKSKIIKKIVYDHPLFTVDSLKAQSRKEEINGKNNSYFCGAYWRNGFHEDGVVSALDVCEKFGESL
jgi:predicted NAD/FAD-binding protein